MPTRFDTTGTGATATIQEWTVPATGGYWIVAAGAGQGSVEYQKGAKISGSFDLSEGDRILVLVGQLPANNSTRPWSGCGGTFVVRENEQSSHTLPDGTPVELLVAAGGAGGFSNDSDGRASIHVPGQAGTKGGDSSEPASGGDDGQGGTQGGACFAQSGAGFIGDGDGCDGDNALAFLNGGTGGTGGDDSEGGYGGGSTGRTNDRLAGAGGYSGGASQGGSTGYGGGGGSFNAGTEQENLGGDTEQGNEGDGWVEIESLSPPAGTVTDPELTAADTTSLAFAWSPVDNADDYQAKLYEGATEVGSVVSVDPAAEFTGLTADTEYGLEITARNEYGDGPTSELFAFSTPPEGAPVDAPTEVEIEGIQLGVAAAWRWVANADEYVMRALTLDGATVASVTTTETEGEITGLDPLTRYRVEIAGANESGEGPAYSENAATTAARYGDDVRLVLQDPTDAITEATIDPDQGLKGHVEDLEGQGLEGRQVHVYARLTGDRVATVETDADGAFVWAGADPEWEYFVVAIDPASDAEDYTPSAANRLTPAVVV